MAKEGAAPSLQAFLLALLNVKLFGMVLPALQTFWVGLAPLSRGYDVKMGMRMGLGRCMCIAMDVGALFRRRDNGWGCIS